MNAKLDTLAKRLDKMCVHNSPQTLIMVCEICGNGHVLVECHGRSLFAWSKQVQYVNNY